MSPTGRRHALAFLRGLVLPHRGLVAAALGGSVSAALLEGLALATFGAAVHVLSVSGPSDLAGELGRLGAWAADLAGRYGRERVFLWLIVAAVVVQVLRSLLRFVGDGAAAALQAGLEGDVRRRLFRHFMAAPFASLARRKVGELSTFIEQVNFLGLAVQRANTVLEQCLLLLVYLVLLLWLSWKVTLVTLAAAVLLTAGLGALMRRVRHRGRGFRDGLVRLGEIVIDLLSGLRPIKSYGREAWAIERADAAILATETARRRVLTLQAAVTPLIDAVSVLAVGTLLVLGYLWLAREDSAGLARLATFLLVLYRAAPRLSVIQKNVGLFQGYLPFVERAADLLEETSTVQERPRRAPLERAPEEIRFEGVSYRYPGKSEQALFDVSFSIRRGEIIGVAGQSGSGKSTLVDLLLGLRAPTAGRITVDGRDLGEVSWDDWRRCIGVVSQDSFLFHATIRENLAFSRPDLGDDELASALRTAHADEFVAALEEGLDTVVGDRGASLSGGQRQRLAIARAVLRDPAILILDEATSDLDSESEARVQEGLEALCLGRTVLTITHRLSGLERADRVLLLHRGRIVESGTHERLLAAGGSYAALADLQGLGGGPA